MPHHRGANEARTSGHENDGIFKAHSLALYTPRSGKCTVDTQEVFAIATFGTPLGKLFEMIQRNIAEPQRNLFETGNTHTLPLLEDLHEVARLDQREVCAGIEPCEAAPQHLNMEVPTLHVGPVDVGNFQLAARRRF